MNKNPKGLWAILAPVKSIIALAMVVNAVSVMLRIGSLVLLAYSLVALLEKQPLIVFGQSVTLTNTLILLACLVILSFLGKNLSFIFSHLGAFRLEQILRIELSSHLAKVPLGVIITRTSGGLKKVMQDDVKKLHSFVADSTPMAATAVVSPLLSVILLFWADWCLALASIVVLIFGFVAMRLAFKDCEYYRKKYEQSQTDINKAVVEFVQAMPVVRTFEDGTSSFTRYNEALKNYRTNLDEWTKQTTFSSKVGMIILTPLPTLLVVFLTGIFLQNFSTLNLTSFILALFLSTGLADALMPLMWMNIFIKQSQAAAFKIFEILEIAELPETKTPKSPASYEVQFEHVSFTYENTTKNALTDINFTMPAGSVTALVGGSGGGKSTVAKLIPRFWDVTGGCIRIGGVDVRDIGFSELMELVSFVFQDTFLFDDTIYNNIALARNNATREQVIAAAKAAQIHDFIESLPDGYDTRAGDRGTSLSGGQKQRITIARAILRNSPIVILDEATAFADPENEEEIVKAQANLTKGKTVLVIAHRLSTIKDVEQIIVLDKGQITEAGRHEELLDNQKAYFKLWNAYLKADKWNLEKEQG